jgi:hypothetical protein
VLDHGVDLDLTRARAVDRAREPLGWLGVHGALMLHEESRPPAEVSAFLSERALISDDSADRWVRFLADAGSRSYAICYPAGWPCAASSSEATPPGSAHCSPSRSASVTWPPRLCRKPTILAQRDSCTPDVSRGTRTRQSGGVLVIVAPGQGAQTPGFLAPWLEDPTFANRFGWLSTVAGLDLAHYGTEADAETIRDTQVAQPLLVATGLIAALELFPHPTDAFGKVGAVAGHSVGRDHGRRRRPHDHRRAGDGAGARARQGNGRGRRGHAHRYDRRYSAATATRSWPPSTSTASRPPTTTARPDRRRPAPRRSSTRSRRPACQGAADPAQRRGCLPHRAHAAGVSHLAGLARAVSTHDPRTKVISNRDGRVVHDGRDLLPASSGRSRARCGGTSAWRRWPTWRVTGPPRDATGRHADRASPSAPSRGSRPSPSRRPTSSTGPASSSRATPRARR